MLEHGEIEYNVKQSTFVDELENLQEQIEKYASLWPIFQKQLLNELQLRQQSNTQQLEDSSISSSLKTKSFFMGYSGNSRAKSQIQSLKMGNPEINVELINAIQTYCPKGLYAYGGPGCGKTFLLDLLFELIDTPHKKRLHFNEFMLRVHQKNFAHSKVPFYKIFSHFYY